MKNLRHALVCYIYSFICVEETEITTKIYHNPNRVSTRGHLEFPQADGAIRASKQCHPQYVQNRIPKNGQKQKQMVSDLWMAWAEGIEPSARGFGVDMGKVLHGSTFRPFQPLAGFRQLAPVRFDAFLMLLHLIERFDLLFWQKQAEERCAPPPNISIKVLL